MICIIVKAVLSTEGGAALGQGRSRTRTRSSCSRSCSSAGRVVFGIGLQLVPHAARARRTAALGLIALFSGFFIMMGLLWAVIGE